MKNCTLTSTQDTLFVGPLPPDLIERYEGFLPDELRRGGDMTQCFEDCIIEGTVDFIFGCGNTLFSHCELRSVEDARNIGYVAAPAHSQMQQDGFRFVNGISVEDLNDFTMKCLGTTYDYTNVQNLSVLYEASCNYDAENNTIVITVLPAGGGGGYELLNYALTSEDQISFTFTAQLMDENGETLDFSFIVDHTGDNYIFWEITSR